MKSESHCGFAGGSDAGTIASTLGCSHHSRGATRVIAGLLGCLLLVGCASNAPLVQQDGSTVQSGAVAVRISTLRASAYGVSPESMSSAAHFVDDNTVVFASHRHLCFVDLRGLAEDKRAESALLATCDLLFHPQGLAVAESLVIAWDLDGHIAVVDSAARQVIARHELAAKIKLGFTPRLSSDGARLAYVSDSDFAVCLPVGDTPAGSYSGEDTRVRDVSDVAFLDDSTLLIAANDFTDYTKGQFWIVDLRASDPVPALVVELELEGMLESLHPVGRTDITGAVMSGALWRVDLKGDNHAELLDSYSTERKGYGFGPLFLAPLGAFVMSTLESGPETLFVVALDGGLERWEFSDLGPSRPRGASIHPRGEYLMVSYPFEPWLQLVSLERRRSVWAWPQEKGEEQGIVGFGLSATAKHAYAVMADGALVRWNGGPEPEVLATLEGVRDCSQVTISTCTLSERLAVVVSTGRDWRLHVVSKDGVISSHELRAESGAAGSRHAYRHMYAHWSASETLSVWVLEGGVFTKFVWQPQAPSVETAYSIEWPPELHNTNHVVMGQHWIVLRTVGKAAVLDTRSDAPQWQLLHMPSFFGWIEGIHADQELIWRTDAIGKYLVCMETGAYRSPGILQETPRGRWFALDEGSLIHDRRGFLWHVAALDKGSLGPVRLRNEPTTLFSVFPRDAGGAVILAKGALTGNIWRMDVVAE